MFTDGGETAAVEASFAEASDSTVCTPFTSGFTYNCNNQKDNLVVPEPAQYCFATGPDVSTADLTQVSTPPACQCQEAFTCTCITAHSTNFPCASPTCNEGVIGGMPVLVLGCP